MEDLEKIMQVAIVHNAQKEILLVRNGSICVLPTVDLDAGEDTIASLIGFLEQVYGVTCSGMHISSIYMGIPQVVTLVYSCEAINTPDNNGLCWSSTADLPENLDILSRNIIDEGRRIGE